MHALCERERESASRTGTTTGSAVLTSSQVLSSGDYSLLRNPTPPSFTYDTLQPLPSPTIPYTPFLHLRYPTPPSFTYTVTHTSTYLHTKFLLYPINLVLSAVGL